MGDGDGRMTIFGTERTFFVVIPLSPVDRASPDGGRRDDDDGSASCSLVLFATSATRCRHMLQLST